MVKVFKVDLSQLGYQRNAKRGRAAAVMLEILDSFKDVDVKLLYDVGLNKTPCIYADKICISNDDIHIIEKIIQHTNDENDINALISIDERLKLIFANVRTMLIYNDGVERAVALIA